MDLDLLWRNRITARCGRAHFDAPGGGYAFSNVLAEERELSRLNRPGDPASALLTLSVADPTWKMRREAMEAALRFYEECPDATRYTDNAGIRGDGSAGFVRDTHTLLAEYLNRRFPDATVEFTADWVQYSPGSIKRALAEYLPTLFFDTQTVLLFPTPGYPVVKSPMNRYDAEVVDVPLQRRGQRWRIPIGVSIPAGLQPVLYANLPHNPTGTGYTAKEWAELIEWARINDVILIVDEAYIDLCYSPEVVSILTVPGWEECAVVLQSVSKGWNATGLRFGWMIAHPTVIRAIRKVTDVKDSGLFGPSIAAGLTCLAHPEWAEETRAAYERLHRLLYEGLRKAGFETAMPDAGLCQFTPAPRSADGVVFADALECAQWFRKELRISLMHYTVEGEPWLRWAVTLKPVPECELPTEEAVLEEVVRRLQSVRFEF
ncbi:MAG: aspartate aminotransferase [Candidatus Poribacteria bacterium]|nr:MAG: aspartate aminotransferase [Candidatus Poribacteria bacterium]